MNNPFQAYTDRERLRTEAYATPDHLHARQSIYRFRVPSLDLVEFARDLIEWRGDERMLDVGSGPGRYVAGFKGVHPGVSAVVADLSPGMAAVARDTTSSPGIVADVSRLPFAARSFDVVLAMHMLYHVVDMHGAIRELQRVAALGATVLVSANSSEHLREIKALFAEALAAVLGRPVPMPPSTDDRFNLENGEALLGHAFESVRRKAAWGTLSIPAAEPIVAYVRSQKPLRSALVPNDDAWQALVAYVERRAAEIISDRGSFEAAARTGVFVCR